jgi:hypothetical protein
MSNLNTHSVVSMSPGRFQDIARTLEAGRYPARTRAQQVRGPSLAATILAVCNDATAETVEIDLPWDDVLIIHMAAAVTPVGPPQAHVHCRRCGRALKRPETIEAGIGPICAQKEAWDGWHV